MRYSVVIFVVALTRLLNIDARPLENVTEEHTSVVLPVLGTFPAELHGTFVYNGPAMFSANGEAVDHWIDGLAMLHSFSLDGGNIRYSNRYLSTDAYEAVLKGAGLQQVGFVSGGRDIAPRDPLAPRPNANVNVTSIASSYVALTEVPLPVAFDLSTAETLGAFRWQDPLPMHRVWESAHPHLDSKSQELVNYLIPFGPACAYTFYRVKHGEQKREVFAQLPTYRPAYVHSFGVTPNYVIFVEWPYYWDLRKGFQEGKSFLDHFKWHPDEPTILHVISRKTGDVVLRGTAPAAFSFHNVNAFETPKGVAVDFVVYSQGADQLLVGNDSDRKGQVIRRYELSWGRDEAIVHDLFSGRAEMPRINPNYEGREYRYAYALVYGPKGPEELVKIDLSSGKVQRWREMGCEVGEPVFIPCMEANSEDEGVVLSVVYDGKRNTSFLLALDGKTFLEKGRAYTPTAIPQGLHGDFFPAD